MRAVPPASAPVRIIPLGGLGEVGMNCMVIESGGDRVVIDCGLMFPNAEQALGVEVIAPDLSYLKSTGKVDAVLLTHAHEDHVGALPYLLAEFPQARRIGLLAYQGTIATGLYHDALRARGLEPLSPSPEEQRRLVDGAIEAVKAGDTRPEVGGWLAQAGQALITRGAEVLLAACTEIPIVLPPSMVSVPLLDPTLILAQAAVRAARTTPALATD